MTIYTIHDLQGRSKWVEDAKGIYLVDPHYVDEFCTVFADAKDLPINVNIF